MSSLQLRIPLLMSFSLSLACALNLSGFANAQAVRVATVQPTEKELLRTVEQPAQVQAYAVAPLFAKVTGYVSKVHVEIGQNVEFGQVLLTIDCPELRAERKEKEALLEQAESAIDQAKAAINVAGSVRLTASLQRDEWAALADKARAESQRYKSEYERISKLVETSAVPTKVRDESESQFRASQAMVAAMTAKQKSGEALIAEADAKHAAAEADLRAATAKKGVAAAALEQVDSLLAFAELKAPFAGAIATRQVDAGHLVSPTSDHKNPLLTVVQTDRLRLAVEVPEIEAGYLAPGNPAMIRFPALSNQTVKAKVTRVAAAIHPDTRTLKAEIELENSEGKLKPGLFAHAQITVAAREKCLTLPVSAILSEGGKNYCLAVKQGQIVKLPVELGLRAGNETEMLAGVGSADQIIPKNPGNYTVGQAAEVIVAPPK